MQDTFGYLPDGTPVTRFTLRNPLGTEVQLMTYGAAIVACKTRDRDGSFGDIALGFSDLDSYVNHSAYFGAVVGRYANRIANAHFSIDGRTYALAANDGSHHLHGGRRGFDKHVWNAKTFEREERRGVTFFRVSPDMEEGYPGNLAVQVQYTLTNGDELVVDYAANSDAPTAVNLTQHTYFNLAQASAADVLDHCVQINASAFTPVTEGLIPNGEIVPVDGTAFDLRTEIAIRESIDQPDDQLRLARGYDHNFVLDRTDGGLVPAARLFEPTTGRTLEVSTTEPGLQFYTGNFLDGTLQGKSGRLYGRRSGLCLETQHFPDSPNRSRFPCTILRPGKALATRTVFRFGIAAHAQS
jgi:aldose 1-epimerase